MEQRPSWEANRSSASQEIPCILRKSTIHHRIHNSSPPDPILSQRHLVRAHHITSPKLILILSSHPRHCLSSGLLPSDFSHLNAECTSAFPHTSYMPAHLSLLKFITLAVPPLSHLNSCAPIKSNLFLATSLTTVVANPDLYRLFTFHVSNIISLFRCLLCTEGSIRFRGLCLCFLKSC